MNDHFRLVVRSCVAAIVAMLLWGCSPEPRAAEPGNATKGPADGAKAAQPAYAASAKGRIDIEGGVVRLAARRDGIIDKVLVEEGARVKEGQVLATLDATLKQQNLELTRRELEEARRRVVPLRVRLAAAERELRRLALLARQDVVARQEYDKAADEHAMSVAELDAVRAAAAAAESRAAVAQREVEEHVVRAPADGQIVQRQARPGNGVSTLNVTPLFLFAPDVPQIIRADLEERFLHVVGPGQPAQVLLEAAPERYWPARVLRMGKVVGQRPPSDDPAEKQDQRVVECVLSIDAPELLIGQRVIVRFERQVATAQAAVR